MTEPTPRYRYKPEPIVSPRLCALPGCDEPVVKREGEKQADWAKRLCCCASHGRKFARLDRDWEGPTMSDECAELVLSLPPMRLRAQFEELPASEQAKVLAARGVLTDAG